INLYRAQSVSVRSVRLAYTDKIRANSCHSQRDYRCSDLKLSSRHPCGRAVFPLIVGELAYIRSVRSHDEDLPVRLEPGFVLSSFILKSHSSAAKQDPFAIRRPG